MSDHFLNYMLPSQGLYCACQAMSKGYAQRFFDNIPALINHIETQDAAGQTMYVAQASFLTPENRKTSNASHLRNFFFDVDCGEAKFAATPTKAYPSQADGCAAIKEFAKHLGLPMPTVINSGNGLYAQWLIDEDIPVTQWKAVAAILKQVAATAGFKQDPSRTSDASSVLRPVGTTNRKGDPKPVRLLHLSQSISLKTFTDAVEKAAKKNHISLDAVQLPTKFKGLNDEFTSGVEGPPSSLLQVADRCAQVRAVRDTQGNVDEPTWYNFLGMARFTTEGKEIVILHDWSKGHPDYSAEGTYKKIQQLEAFGAGPTTCEKFGSDNPAGCYGCPHANKVKSPIVLGRPDPVSIATPEEEEVLPPGFKRNENGMFWSEDDAVWHRFYPYDIYVTALAFDYTLGYEVATIRHKMPVSEEYESFTVRASLLHDPKALLMVLADNHVQTTGAEPRKQMINYIDNAMAAMRAKRALANLHSQMGWKDINGEKTFILGEQLFKRNEEVQSIGFAQNVPESAKAFRAEGSIEEWSGVTKMLSMKGMEPYAFAFLAGAFGAPLVKFTGYAGAMVAMIGDSGIGKTLLGEWILSTYGQSQKLILLKDDTKNFLVQRLGLYGSLPLYVDEISNIEGQDLSEIVYKVTQGRDKGRLNRAGGERALINSWATVAVVSSNHSLNDKLSALKTDASAEMNRIMEINCGAVEGFGRDTATQVYRTFQENYGVAGPVYVKYLTDHQDQHQAKIDQIVKALDLSTEAKPEERFWSAVCGVAIYGGLIAQKLGLIQFSVAPILEWAKEHIKNARVVKYEQITNYSDMLGQFLDANMRGILVTRGNGVKEVVVPMREPTGNLVCRIDTDTERMYISRSSLKAYLERTYGSYSKLRTALENNGALLDANKRRVLGSGTYFSGSQQPVWEIDLACRALGVRTLGLVRNFEEVRKIRQEVV